MCVRQSHRHLWHPCGVPSDIPTEVIEVPPQSGRGFRLNAGDTVRIIDAEGTQVADVFARAAEDPDSWLSTSHTRGGLWRLFPQPGEPFLSNHFQPMLWFDRDDSPGVHDMFFSACSPAMYAALGHEGPHPSCQANFFAAAADLGWQPEVEPDPVNIFQNTPISAEGELTSLPALSRAGDSVSLRAEIDLLMVVTACSMDLKPINGERCTGLRLEITRA